MSTRALARLQGKAASTYKMWTKKPVSQWLGGRHHFPSSYDIMGQAVDIYYTSDKWRDDGDVVDYVHDFKQMKSGPFVFESARSGQYRVNMSDSDTEAWAILGVVTKITFIDADGEEMMVTWTKKNPALMCAAPDKKWVIIIPPDSHPLWIYGGQMRVTARGLVD